MSKEHHVDEEKDWYSAAYSQMASLWYDDELKAFSYES